MLYLGNQRSANTILRSFCQNPFGIRSAGVGTNARHGNWGIILEIEDCQRQFTKIIEGMGLLPYRQRLQRLRLTTLLECRIRVNLDFQNNQRFCERWAQYVWEEYSLSNSYQRSPRRSFAPLQKLRRNNRSLM